MTSTARSKKQQLADDYGAVFTTAHGRRVLADLMSRADFFGIWPTPEMKSAEITLGERNIVSYILSQCNLSKMTSEEYSEFTDTARHNNRPDDPVDSILNRD